MLEQSSISSTLRILATSDLHMHLRGYNYTADTPTRQGGLARVATLVDSARAEHSQGACILLDNGDTLQGTALADTLRTNPDNHPLAKMFNWMRYDAIGLGNHDFDFGLDYLNNFISQLEAPVVSSNLGKSGLDRLNTHVILDRDMPLNGNTAQRLRIGILSVLPTQTLQWNHAQFPKATTIENMLITAQRDAQILKSEGADIIVLLAHSGISTTFENADSENVALQLARVADIDAIIAGHTHVVFPGPDIVSSDGVDSLGGTLHGIPAVKPGFAGSHLAQIDLKLSFENDNWRINSHVSTAIPAGCKTVEHAKALALSAAAHTQTLTQLDQAVGHLNAPIYSGFSLLQTSAEMTLMANAMHKVVKDATVGTEFEGLPVLCAVAPSASGGRAGSQNYFKAPAGPILYRHALQLCPFEDDIWALAVTDAEIRDWLERSAAIYTQLLPDALEQTVLLRNAPRFNFDVIFGLTYHIDPFQPAKFGLTGEVVDPQAARVKDIRFGGAPLRDDAQFVMAATNYRVAGGGRFPNLSADRCSLKTKIRTLDALLDTLSQSEVAPFSDSYWRFAPSMPGTASFYTAHDACSYLDSIAHLNPEVLEPTVDGFSKLQLHF